jgi:hypothetical protein
VFIFAALVFNAIYYGHLFDRMTKRLDFQERLLKDLVILLGKQELEGRIVDRVPPIKNPPDGGELR